MLGSREPNLDDKGSLPYCEATVMEIQRHSCVAPASLDHKPIRETKVKGYKLPEGKEH